MNRQCVYSPGEVVFLEGSPGTAIYLVRRGAVEIWRGSGDHRTVLGRITQGGIFGEMACIDDSPRMASATAVEESVLLRIEADRVRAALAKTDPIIRRLLGLVLASLRRTASSLEAVERARAAQARATDPGGPTSPEPC